MRFSYNWLKELLPLKESPHHVAELLTLHSFEAAVAGRVGSDWTIEAKIPTNRISDVAHHHGLARELAAILSRAPRLESGRKTKHLPAPSGVPPVSIRVASRLCPRYSAQAMTVRLRRRSPAWMRGRLAACGFRAVNAIVDVTNYVMLERGQPLHAFDLDHIRGGAMTIREARRGEAVATLGGRRHALPKGALVIEDRERLIDLAGIMGGEHSAVSDKTRRILLEAAVFDPVRTYRTMRALNFSSEAAKIYAAGIDTERTMTALERAGALLDEIAGARALGAPIDIYPRPSSAMTIPLRLDYAKRLIGEDIPATFFTSCFKRLGWRTEPAPWGYNVHVPIQRRDLRIEQDIVEEIARLWGYQRLRAKAPETNLAPGAVNEELSWQRRIEDLLVGAGLTEVQAYRFIGKQALERFGSSAEELLELENPMSPETQYVGAHPAEQYLAIAAENLRHQDRVAVFGMAKGFRPARRPSANMPADERKYLVIVKASKAAGVAKGGETFYEVKGVLDRVFETLGIAEHWYDDALTKAERQRTKALHPYRTAKVMVGDDFLGMAAELHPAVQQRLKAKARLVCAHIDFDKLWKLARAEAEFRPIGKYPAVIRDIAMIVPENTKADDVEGVIENAGGPLLVDADLFDYFQDEAMEERGEQSLAFHLVFQSPKKTLTDEEVNRPYRKIVSALKSRDWEVRT